MFCKKNTNTNVERYTEMPFFARKVLSETVKKWIREIWFLVFVNIKKINIIVVNRLRYRKHAQ